MPKQKPRPIRTGARNLFNLIATRRNIIREELGLLLSQTKDTRRHKAIKDLIEAMR